MSNIPFEPKDGDYVSLIERLGKTSIDEIKDEIAKTQLKRTFQTKISREPLLQ